MANKKKTKRIKKEKFQTEEQNEVKRFIVILVILIILVLGVYFFTRLFVTKDLLDKETEEETTAGKIDYSVTLVGNMLNKLEKDYYVILYDSVDINAGYYGNLVNNYKQGENSLAVYTVDLSNEFNKKYVSEKSNLYAKDLKDFRVKDVALLKIKDGKVIQAFEEEKEIEKQLSK